MDSPIPRPDTEATSLASRAPSEAGAPAAEDQALQRMDPRKIKFSQAKISSVFSRRILQPPRAEDGGRASRASYSAIRRNTPIISLQQTLAQLRDGSLTLDQLPPIRVCKHDGHWYSLDNRRLWVLREFGQSVPVRIENDLKEFFRKFDSRPTGGEWVTFLDAREKDPVDESLIILFSNLVLQWSIQDVQNENMYVNKVEEIPKTFPSLKAYYKAFRFLLLEETRSQLQQGLESIGSVPYMSLNSVEEKIGKPSSRNGSRKSFILTIGKTGKDLVERNNKEAPWKPKPTDMVILSTLVPESVDDLQRSGELYTFAELTKSPELDETDIEAQMEDSPRTLTVVAYAPAESPEYEEMIKGQRSWYVLFLGSLATGSRIWDALHPELPLVEPSEFRAIVRESLYTGVPQEDGLATDSSVELEEADELEADIENYCHSKRLNESQTEAVRSTLMGFVNKDGFRVRLIQGPPGTGKTKTTAVLLSIVSCLTERVLVCAPTNRAVSEIAGRFVQQLGEDIERNSRFADCASPASTRMRFCRPLDLADVVMIGSEEKLTIDGILDSIYLPNRANRLQRALAFSTGWRHTARALVQFLTDASSEHEMSVLSSKELNSEEPILDFLQFLRKRVGILVPTMIENAQIMSNDLPTKMLSVQERRAIKDACLFAERMIKSLGRKDLSDAKVRQCFQRRFSQPGDENFRCDFCDASNNLLQLLEGDPGYFINGINATVTCETIEWLCLQNALLVFCTTATAGRRAVVFSGAFNYAVIDEAAQLVEAETAIVTQLRGIDRALLVGDPQQLQALVTSQIAQDCKYGRSLFERLQTLGHPYHLLNVQYRMHPQISSFPTRRFYSGSVHDGPNVLATEYERRFHDRYASYAFIDVADGEEERSEDGKSWRNSLEAEVVHSLIKIIQSAAKEKSEDVDVGVISPYNGQIGVLKKRTKSLVDAAPVDGRAFHFKLSVKTVDGFQGGERDIIIFSAVRDNAGGHIGFLDDPRRLNVALTRGRYCLWIVGSSTTLAARDEIWRALVADAKRRDCFWDARDDPQLRKTIIKAKQELEQYASLLDERSVLFKDTLWRVLFSKEFKDTVVGLKPTEKRQRILNAILNLAHGRRSRIPTRCTTGMESFRQMTHVQKTAGLILVWTVDVEKGSPSKQLLRIWNAVESSHLAGFIGRLHNRFATFTDAYIERCSKVKLVSKAGIVEPVVWKHDPSFKWTKAIEMKRSTGDLATQEGTPQLERANVDESVLLMKFYTLTSGIAKQLLKAKNGSQIEMLFEVNDEEAAILVCPQSKFILGRSGTGKTTVITARLLGIEQQYRLCRNVLANGEKQDDCPTEGQLTEHDAPYTPATADSRGTDFLRQVLITLSPKLCAAIKRQITKTSRTMLAEDSTSISPENGDEDEDVMLDEEEEAKLMGAIPDTIVNISPVLFPLVVTFRKFLAMLDGSVTCPFLLPEETELPILAKTHRYRFEGSESSETDSEDPLNQDHSMDHDGSESDLDGTSFHDSFEELEEIADEGPHTDSRDCGGQDYDLGSHAKSVPEVTFEIFSTIYWIHFNKTLTKNLDPSVVFTEILSFIKGSLEALHTESGKLTRDEYLSMAGKRSSTFNEEQRAAIYKLFLLYERRKSERREYDLADYCIHLYRQMKSGAYRGLQFHYVYVDEVQDLTMAQIALLKFVCSNVEDGYVFAGDTAQTIARGVSFRFEDIRCLFYEEFLNSGINQSLEQPALTGKDIAIVSKRNVYNRKEKNPRMPNLHYLSRNFRTHVGIVNIANSVVELLYHFFPSAVDKLDPESSLILGDTPIFLDNEQNNQFVANLFGHGGAAGGGGCDFGAEQVILVRDAEAKRHMIEKLGKGGLVMTVHDCKGLEFQDVLLYNFFADSILETKWRVVLSFMAGRSNEDMSYPQFDKQKHNLLMSELKQLYVVITRARQRLWIYDECPAHHKPMLEFWNQSGLIQVKGLDEELIKSMHGKSTPEDWRRRGRQMFSDRHYDMAQLSFERAGDMYLANWAKAAGLQQAGERRYAFDSRAGAQLFRDAATLYLELRKTESAANCFKKIGEYKNAGIILRDSCSPPRLEEAGDCLSKAKLWREAAEAYRRCWCVKRCLESCFRGNLLDLGDHFLSEWEHQKKDLGPVEDGLEKSRLQLSDEFDKLKEEYFRRCAQYYHSKKNSEQMMRFVRRFPNVNSQKVFLCRRDYFDLILEVEEGEGNFVKAAEIAESKGDLRHAANLLERGGCYQQAVEKVLEHVLYEMLWSGGKRGWPLEPTSESESLLQMARRVVDASPDAVEVDLQQELQLLSEIHCLYKTWKIGEDTKSLLFCIIASRQAMEQNLSKSETASEDSAMNLVLDTWPIWEWWSSTCISLIQALQRATMLRDTHDDQHLLEVSNKYMGAKKQKPTDKVYLATDAGSFWLKDGEVTHLPNQGRRCHLSARTLFNLAKSFWERQLWDVGSSVIRMLDGVLFTGEQGNAQSFSSDCFQPRGELLCKLYSVTESLMELLSNNVVTEKGYLDLRARQSRYGKIIFEASFPFRVNSKNMENLLAFRDEVGILYDSIATRMKEYLTVAVFEGADIEWVVGGAKVGVIETAVKLHLLLPWVSRQWIKKHGPSIGLEIKRKIRPGKQSTLWSKIFRDADLVFHTVYDVRSKKLDFVLSTCELWAMKVCSYWGFLPEVYNHYWNVVHPFTFLQMLERCTVMNLACQTHLHGLVLPESMVANVMTGDSSKEIFSSMLNMSCTKFCQNLQTVRRVLNFVLKLLTSSENYYLEDWLSSATLQWQDCLQDLVFRLVVVVLTVCINTWDADMWTATRTGLGKFLWSGSPLLQGLPGEFRKELKRVFSGRPFMDNQIRATVVKAMRAAQDGLVVFKTSGKRVPDWAPKSRIPIIYVSRVVHNERRFECGYAPAQKPVSVQVPEAGTTERTVGDQVKPEDGDAARSRGEARETNLIEDSKGDNYQLADDENPQEADMANDSIDEEAVDARRIPPGHVSVGEGTVPFYVKERLLERLSEARERAKQELAPTKRYERDARTSFWKQNINDKEFCELFLAEACPLKASTDEWVQRLEASIQALKDDDAAHKYDDGGGDDVGLDDFFDAKDALEKAVVILDPLHEAHMEQDLRRLQGNLLEVKTLLEEGMRRFESRISNMEKKLGASKKHNGSSSGKAGETTASQSNGKSNSKKKPQKKKKKGRR